MPRVTTVTRPLAGALRRRPLPFATGGGVFVLAIAGLLSLAVGPPGPVSRPHLVGIDPTVTVEQLPRRSPAALASAGPSASASPSPEPTGPTQPPNQRPPAGPPPAPPAFNGPPAGSVTEAVANAYAAGAGRAARIAVAVLDRSTWTFYGAGATDSSFASASIVKVFIAARLLVEGKANDPAVRDRMWRMISCSDDDAANSLYYTAGGEGLAGWISARYGISVGPTPRPGWWGLTRITARGMVSFYAQIAGEAAVGPWLMSAMGSASAYACDGYYQHFGIPSAAASWRVKQGWMCCLDGLTRMHSTGFVDGDRYTVALMIEGSTSLYSGSGGQTLTAMARALLPNGVIPQAPPEPPLSPSDTPSASGSPSTSSEPPTDPPTPSESATPSESTTPTESATSEGPPPSGDP